MLLKCQTYDYSGTVFNGDGHFLDSEGFLAAAPNWRTTSRGQGFFTFGIFVGDVRDLCFV